MLTRRTLRLSAIPLASLVLAAAAALVASGCGARPRRQAVPSDQQAYANVVGFPRDIRYFPLDAGHVTQFENDFLRTLDREREILGLAKGVSLPPSTYLAISGGGDNGAFGAGLLNGWTKAGTRPVFKLVTGVSTGALTAPFAFLGSAYDERVKSLYTNVTMTDIAVKRTALSAITDDAMTDNAPLWKLVKKYMTRELLDAIAAEHEKGRILLIATTNLDLRNAVIWNVTKIAASRLPGRLELVQRILIASAAIPGTFPPVMIDVEAQGKKYQEMHVDGGTVAQVFIYPAAIHLQELAKRQRKLYLIRNARLDPDWAETERRTLPIAFRAIRTLIQSQGMGDLYRIYAIAQRDELDYNLAYIPRDFYFPHKTDFDTSYMRALFAVGERLAAQGYEWSKTPPVIVTGVDDKSAKGSR
jgi:predicted patatin/cPLA2 family phospholipase